MTAMQAMAARRVVRGSGVVQQDDVEQMRQRMSRLHALMDEWVMWCRSDFPRVGFPRYSAMIQGAPASGADRAESGRAEVVGAAVEDLPPIQRAAVHRRYGVVAVWRFPRNNYAEMLEQALDALIKILRRRGIDIDA